MSPALKHLHSQTYTVTDLHRRLRLMQEALESVLFAPPQQLRVPPLLTRLTEALAAAAEEDRTALLSLEESIWNSFTPATVTASMQNIHTQADALPVMKLYVPVHFTDKQLAPLAAWARAEVEPGLLFEVMVDPQVVGGCAFVYKDTHFDWSLRRYLRAKKGMITALLNAYGE